eukprot:scaffold1486_cov314-Pavlova_lutheri.AAC.9
MDARLICSRISGQPRRTLGAPEHANQGQHPVQARPDPALSREVRNYETALFGRKCGDLSIGWCLHAFPSLLRRSCS